MGLENSHYREEQKKMPLHEAPEEIHTTESLGSLKEDVEFIPVVPPFAVSRKESLDHSFEDSRDKESFRSTFRNRFDGYKNRRIQGRIHKDALNEDGDLDIDKLQAINTLLGEYDVRFPTDILDEEPETINSFASAYSEIVDIPEQDLILAWIEIRGEQLEWDKLSLLIDDDGAAEDMYESLNKGEEVPWENLYEDYAHVLEDVNEEQDALEELEMDILDEYAEVDIEIDSDFSLIEDSLALANLAGKYSLDPDTTSIYIDGLGEMEASIQVIGDSIEISDSFDKITIDSSNDIGLKEALEIFEMKTIFHRFVERENIVVPNELHPFFYGASFAKFAAHTADKLINIGGQDLDRTFEIEAIYLSALEMDDDWILDLHGELHEYGEEDYDSLAEEMDL
jgi:hypothetical protein